MNVSGISKPPFLLDPDAVSWLRDPQNANTLYKWFVEQYGAFPYVRSYQPTLTPTAVSASSESTQTFTVLGLRTNDVVLVNKPTKTASISVLDAFVSAKDQISLTFRNFSGGSLTPPSEVYRIIAMRM